MAASTMACECCASSGSSFQSPDLSHDYEHDTAMPQESSCEDNAVVRKRSRHNPARTGPGSCFGWEQEAKLRRQQMLNRAAQQRFR